MGSMIAIKTKKEVEILKEAGKILASILREVADKAKPGISTLELDKCAENLILDAGGKPSFKGYKSKESDVPFPASMCVSVNDEVVHGIPSGNRVLREGDLVSFDLGMEYPLKRLGQARGLYVDMARTVGIGSLDDTAEKLLRVGERALEIAAARAREGNRVGDIGAAVQEHVESGGFNVVRKLIGHGVGYAVHEEPAIPNFGRKKSGPKLKKGMVLALEPMITEREFDVFLDKNGWTWKTKDGFRSVHFEDTVVVGDERAEIITSL